VYIHNIWVAVNSSSSQVVQLVKLRIKTAVNVGIRFRLSVKYRVGTRVIILGVELIVNTTFCSGSILPVPLSVIRSL